MHRLCICIQLSVTFHLIDQFFTSRISVRFVKAGSESLWSMTPLASSQLCTDVGICLDRSNSRIRDFGPLLANNFMVEQHFMCEYSDQSHSYLQQQGHRQHCKCSGSFLFTDQFQSYFSVPKLLVYFIWIFSMYLRPRRPFAVFSIVKKISKKISNFLFGRTKLLKSGCQTTLRYPCRKLFAPSYACIFIVLCYSVYTGCFVTPTANCFIFLAPATIPPLLCGEHMLDFLLIGKNVAT